MKTTVRKARSVRKMGKLIFITPGLFAGSNRPRFVHLAARRFGVGSRGIFFGLVHVCASGTHRLGRAPFLHQAGAYKPSGWVLRLVQIVTNA